jgi:hypothetical protein
LPADALIFPVHDGMFFSGKSMNWIKVTINGRELNVGFDDSSIHVYNAFPVKDDLKLRGYRWDPADKSWFVTPSNIEDELEVLKNNLRGNSRIYPPFPSPIR